MTRKSIVSALCLTLFAATSCTGMRESNGFYTVHAESFRIFGFAIPSDDQEAAAKLHAQHFNGSTITSSGCTGAFESTCSVVTPCAPRRSTRTSVLSAFSVNQIGRAHV